MQFVQDTGSSNSLTQKEYTDVTNPNASKQPGASLRGLNRLCVWQQQFLLQTFGLAWMGLVMAAMLYAVQPIQPAEGMANAAPAQTTKTVPSQPDSLAPGVQTIKVDVRTAETKASTSM